MGQILNKTELLADLKSLTIGHKSQLESFRSYSEQQLNHRSEPGRWSLLENIEHLNRYAEFYIPVIEEAIIKSKLSESEIFKSGWLGNKFALGMLPVENMATMNTFKSKNPLGANLTVEVIDTFEKYLNRLDKCLDKCQKLSLNKYTKITIPLLQIKLGDTLRVTIYHHERHMVQIAKIGL